MDEDDIDAMVREVTDSIRRGPYDAALRGVHDMLTIPMQMEAELTAANARIAELESALMDKTLNKVDVCIQLDAAEKRIAALEALLGEAPHEEECDALAFGEIGNVRPGDLPCNCFKSRA